MRMDVGERKVTVYEREIRAEHITHRLHDRVRRAAVWALVVAVFDQRE
jgi:hypothetical protein